MIGTPNSVIVVEDVRFRVIGNWETLNVGDLYIAKRRGPYKIGICKHVNYRRGRGLNLYFDPQHDTERYTGWVVGDNLDGGMIYPFDLDEVSKVEMLD